MKIVDLFENWLRDTYPKVYDVRTSQYTMMRTPVARISEVMQESYLEGYAEATRAANIELQKLKDYMGSRAYSDLIRDMRIGE